MIGFSLARVHCLRPLIPCLAVGVRASLPRSFGLRSSAGAVAPCSSSLRLAPPATQKGLRCTRFGQQQGGNGRCKSLAKNKGSLEYSARLPRPCFLLCALPPWPPSPHRQLALALPLGPSPSRRLFRPCLAGLTQKAIILFLGLLFAGRLRLWFVATLHLFSRSRRSVWGGPGAGCRQSKGLPSSCALRFASVVRCAHAA